MTLGHILLTVDANGDLHVVYSHNSIEKLYHSTETSTGWSATEILSIRI